MIPIGVDQNDIQTSLGKDRSEEGTHAARSDDGDIGVCDSHQQTYTKEVNITPWRYAVMVSVAVCAITVAFYVLLSYHNEWRVYTAVR